MKRSEFNKKVYQVLKGKYVHGFMEYLFNEGFLVEGNSTEAVRSGYAMVGKGTKKLVMSEGTNSSCLRLYTPHVLADGENNESRKLSQFDYATYFNHEVEEG